MDNYLLCGMAFGDEGKGTFVDYLSQNGLFRDKKLIRYNGGSQASHTVVTEFDKVHKFSQLSAGMFNKEAKTYLLNNMVVNLQNLIVEIEVFSKKVGISVEDILKRVFLESECLIVTPYHKLINKLEEEILGKNSRGSVGTGVSITKYLSDTQNIGIRISDFKDEAIVVEKLQKLKEYAGVIYQNYLQKISKNIFENEWNTITSEIFISRFVCKCQEIISRINVVDDFLKNIKDNVSVIMEGSQGLLLDKNYGLKPNTTYLDNTNFNGKKTFEQLNQSEYINIGVVKAFYSRHGKGVFPTEDTMLNNTLSDENQNEGRYNGKIRFGWFDAVLFNYAQKINKVDEIYLSSLDMFTGIDTLKVCAAYKYKGLINNDAIGHLFDIEYDNVFDCFVITKIKKNEYIDSCKEVHYASTYLEYAEPIYKEIKGWYSDISHCKFFSELPYECIKYIHYLEFITDVKVSLVSVGPKANNKIIIP